LITDYSVNGKLPLIRLNAVINLNNNANHLTIRFHQAAFQVAKWKFWQVGTVNLAHINGLH